ncbi:MAG: CPBP family intramembrane metalloprotease [Chloroflexota bacterium]|nr:CPBP family intramembrane metalloprotease [Chloroflexota bacterium]
MNAHSGSLHASVAGLDPATAVDRRLARAAAATLVIGGYMALGFALGLGAEAYLLLGIPITIGFQVLVVRRPLRSLWLRQAPPMTFTPRSIVAIVVLAISPAIVAVGGARAGDPALVGWGLAAMVGAVGAVYALRAMDRDAVRTTIRTTLITGAVLVGIMVAYRLATGGFNGNLTAAITTTVISLLTYLPVVFVMEEVLFRGLIDTYLHGSTPGPDRASALYGSALWGIWHLPVAFLSLGVLTIPYLIVVHTILGYFFVTSWRRTGNLAVPGVAHAVIDALRNAVAVL